MNDRLEVGGYSGAHTIACGLVAANEPISLCLSGIEIGCDRREKRCNSGFEWRCDAVMDAVTNGCAQCLLDARCAPHCTL
ncbi:hypothetical protein [Burkholderia sp. SRS-W-2-2016]|uniref:hypothetical protein n=1 Tax=Burkholderia sp. SRS-W-2-2016 TaxID=1926878 RepID=UPI00117C699C|nr:hypothetical protein [Burkholderia sp. SRS-W-2-2016]